MYKAIKIHANVMASRTDQYEQLITAKLNAAENKGWKLVETTSISETSVPGCMGGAPTRTEYLILVFWRDGRDGQYKQVMPE